MKNIKKLLVFALIVSILSLCFSLSMAETEPAAIRVASMKGPTSMGMVKLMIDDSESATAQDYEFTVAGAATEIVPLIAQDAIDIALVPCNLAATVYNNTGKVQVAAVNTLGVLYILETGETIQSIEDLRGQTIYSTGKGTTPEYGLRHVLSKAGIDPDKDVTIEYKSEAAEVLAAIKSGLCTVAMLPQPFVTAAMSQVEGLRVALDLTEEWDDASDDSKLTMGCVVVRTAFARENPDVVRDFLAEYEASIGYMTDSTNLEEAGALLEQYGIVPKAAIAKKALPQANITFVSGVREIRDTIQGYYEVLYAANPAAIGGGIPDDAFYFE